MFLYDCLDYEESEDCLVCTVLTAEHERSGLSAQLVICGHMKHVLMEIAVA